MHIALFVQHYHTPDCPTSGRPYVLARHLGRRHRVTVFTTREWHTRRLAHRHPWAPPGVDVRMLDVPYDNQMGAAQRLGAFAGYAARAVLAALRHDRPDLVIGSSTPLTVAAAAALVAARYRAPWIFEVRDLWPDFPVQMGAVPGRLPRKALYALEHALYRHAARVVTLSPDMQAHVCRYLAHPDKVRTIHYGADLGEVAAVRSRRHTDLLARFGLDDRHIILYAGRFGRASAIPTLLDAARRLRGRDGACFVFAGDGYHEDDIRAAAGALPNVRLLPPQPLHRALMLFRLATVSVTSFIDLPVLATNAPAKLSDSLACGTPVIVTNDGWTHRLVEANGCGWYVPPGDVGALAARVAYVLDHPDERQRAAARAVQTAERMFDRTTALRQWDAIVEAACTS